VLTLHDLSPLRLPETLSRSAAWYWRTILPRAVARADVVITDSEFSRREICAHFGLAPDRVVAIPLAVEPRFRRVDDEDQLAMVRRRYDLADEFLLYVGIASPRKNLERLVRAFAALPAGVRGGAHLIMAGPRNWEHPALDRAIAAAPAGLRIRRLGVVADADLPALYTLARGAVNISLYEGFGLPALEALACETPLLCANTSAFPEVVGDCALLVEPREDDAVAAGLAALLTGGPEVAARRQRGRARAAQLTWRVTAERTLAVYERVTA
jgi:glycosyltransferase involved in cell wall biosynthesis